MSNGNWNRAVMLLASAAMLTACGGDGDDSGPDPAPEMMDTTPPTITSSATEFETRTGDVVNFSFTAQDSSGFADNTTVSCDSGSATAAVSGAGSEVDINVVYTPPIVDDRSTDTCTVTVNDSEGNSSSLGVSIIVDFANVDPLDFEGVWNGPCYNNLFGFSVQQTIDITGDSLTSEIQSYTNGQNPAQGCVLPEGGTLVETSTINSVDYGANVSEAVCLNRRALETDLQTASVTSSGFTADDEPEITDTLDLVTGFLDVLPDQSNVCLLDNGNLLFGGVEYTRDFNATVIDVVFDFAADIRWNVDEFAYAGTFSTLSVFRDTSGTEGGDDEILSVVTEGDSSNGAFSGSSLGIRYLDNGTGAYSIIAREDYDDFAEASPTAKIATLIVTVGTSSSDPTSFERYITADTVGQLLVVEDEQGRLHFSTSRGFNLVQDPTLPTTIEGAPENVTFTLTNAYDVSN